ADGASVTRCYGADDRLLREYAGPGAMDTLHIGPLDVTRSGTAETTTRVQAQEQGVLLGEVVGDRPPTWTLADYAGSVMLRLAADGTVKSYERYLPYGAPAFAVIGDPAAAIGTLPRYDGQRRGRHLGLCDSRVQNSR